MEYKNQYLGLQPHEKLRTTFEIGLKDVAAIRRHDPHAGTIQTTASILFKKLIHELERANIECGDFSAYQVAVCDCTINLGGKRSAVARTSTGSVPTCAVQTPQGNDGRGATDVAQQTPRPQELSDPASAPRARRNVGNRTKKSNKA